MFGQKSQRWSWRLATSFKKCLGKNQRMGGLSSTFHLRRCFVGPHTQLEVDGSFFLLSHYELGREKEWHFGPSPSLLSLLVSGVKKSKNRDHLSFVVEVMAFDTSHFWKTWMCRSAISQQERAKSFGFFLYRDSKKGEVSGRGGRKDVGCLWAFFLDLENGPKGCIIDGKETWERQQSLSRVSLWGGGSRSARAHFSSVTWGVCVYVPLIMKNLFERNKSKNKGLISADRRTKPTLMLTIPHSYKVVCNGFISSNVENCDRIRCWARGPTRMRGNIGRGE